MPLANLTREAVIRAIAEYDAIGSDAFLGRYGYRPPRSYFLVHEGRRYPSKAIVGVAHGHVSAGFTPLRAAEFSGGEKTVARILKGLGFEIFIDAGPKLFDAPFQVGRVYSRRNDIHAEFGGQQQGGISTPDGAPFIFLFTGEMGEQYGYEDGGRKGCSCMWGKGSEAIWSLFAETRPSGTMP
jgi:5-methylcytosine-specific restriction protein A